METGHFYCFVPQTNAVIAHLLEMGVMGEAKLRGHRAVLGIGSAQQLKGITGGTWIDIDGHGAHTPIEIEMQIRANRMYVMTLSDRHLRDGAASDRILENEKVPK